MVPKDQSTCVHNWIKHIKRWNVWMPLYDVLCVNGILLCERRHNCVEFYDLASFQHFIPYSRIKLVSYHLDYPKKKLPVYSWFELHLLQFIGRLYFKISRKFFIHLLEAFVVAKKNGLYNNLNAPLHKIQKLEATLNFCSNNLPLNLCWILFSANSIYMPFNSS